MAYIESSAVARTTTSGESLSVQWPVSQGVQQNNMFILHVMVFNSSNIPSVPGWTAFSPNPINAGTSRNYLYWRRATGNESGNETVAFGSADTAVKAAWIHRFDNVIDNSVPYSGYTYEATNGTTYQDRTITVTNEGSHAIRITGVEGNFATFNAPTGGISWVQKAYYTVAGGPTFQILESAGPLSIGSYSAGTGSTGQTLSNKSTMNFDLKAATVPSTTSTTTASGGTTTTTSSTSTTSSSSTTTTTAAPQAQTGTRGYGYIIG